MAAHDYPIDIPLCRSATYSEVPITNWKEQGNQFGGNSRRAGGTKQFYRIEGIRQPKLTQAQVTTLLEFHDATLGFGVEAFNVDHPRTEETIEAVFVERPVISRQAGGLFLAEFDIRTV